MPNLSKQEYRKRKQENKIEMLQLIEEWEQSGESQTSFCKNKNVSFHTFYYWLRRYKDQPPEATTSKTFIPVTIPVNEMTSSIEIHYPNGVRIVLPKNSDLSMVRTFINMV